MTLDEMIVVLTAAKEGKKIQYKNRCGDGRWKSAGHPMWQFTDCEYRVAPEPREWWINVYPASTCNAYRSQDLADSHQFSGRIECIHVHEVLDEGA